MNPSSGYTSPAVYNSKYSPKCERIYSTFHHYYSMKKILIILLSTIFLVVIQIFSLIYGVIYDWPDFYHIRYGFPLVWSTHTLNTLIGPVDIWKVDLTNLVLDLIFWNILILALISFLSSFFERIETRRIPC